MKNSTPRGYFWEALAVFAAAAGIMALRFLLGAGDLCDPESSCFLQIYTEPGKSLAQTIFDPRYTDWNFYQARELSYLLDWCDAQIIRACILARHTHFFSVVNALLTVAAAMVLHFGFRCRMTNLGRWGAALAALLFVVAPSSGEMAFFRSAKPAVSLGIAVAGIAAWSIFRRREEPVPRQPGAWIALCTSLMLLPYCDRLGIFFTAVTAMAGGAFLLILSLKSPADRFGATDPLRRRLAALTLTALFSVLLATLYDLEIAPRLIFHFNGYRPSFEYQNIGTPGNVLNFGGGLIFLLDNIGFSFCGVGDSAGIAAGAFLTLFWLLLCVRYAKKNTGGWLLFLLVAGIFASMTVSANLMTARHESILLPDVIHTGYFQPFLTVLLLLLAVSIEVMGGEIPAKRRFWIPTLLAAVIGIHTLGIVTAKREPAGHLALYIHSSPELIRCLNDPAVDPETLLIPLSYLHMVEHFRSIQRGSPTPARQ